MPLLYLSLCWFLQIAQFLDSHGFLDYLERGLGSGENNNNNNNLLDKLQDAIGRGQNPTSILPSSLVEPEIITISDPDVGISGVFDATLFWDCQLYTSIIKRQRYLKLEIIIFIFFIFFGSPGSGAKYTYDRFPSNVRTEEQEEKRRQILAAASGAFDFSGKHTPRYIYICDNFKMFCWFQCCILIVMPEF